MGGDDRRLFDTREDPGELRDVAADNPEMVETLWNALINEAGGSLPDVRAEGGSARWLIVPGSPAGLGAGRGGASIAGAAVLGATGVPGIGARAARAQGSGGRDIPNVLLIVVDGIRADFVSAYDDPDDRADTPNLDELAKDSLRFDRAIPETMPAFPSRRGLLSGMRSYPFRDWRPTEGLAQYPGWHPIWDHQPILTEALEAGGISTLYISDNPLLDGDRFRGVARRPEGGAGGHSGAAPDRAAVPGGIEEGGDRPAKRVMDSGIKALGELKGKQPFFLGVDVFDRVEATDPTPVFARPAIVSRLGNRGAAARVDEDKPGLVSPIRGDRRM